MALTYCIKTVKYACVVTMTDGQKIVLKKAQKLCVICQCKSTG